MTDHGQKPFWRNFQELAGGLSGLWIGATAPSSFPAVGTNWKHHRPLLDRVIDMVRTRIEAKHRLDLSSPANTAPSGQWLGAHAEALSDAQLPAVEEEKPKVTQEQIETGAVMLIDASTPFAGRLTAAFFFDRALNLGVVEELEQEHEAFRKILAEARGALALVEDESAGQLSLGGRAGQLSEPKT